MVVVKKLLRSPIGEKVLRVAIIGSLSFFAIGSLWALLRTMDETFGAVGPLLVLGLIVYVVWKVRRE